MTTETKEALLNGASMFIEPINISILGTFIEDGIKFYDISICEADSEDALIKCNSLYQINQKLTIDNKEIGTIKSVKVVKVQDIDAIGIANIMKISIPIPRCIDGAKKAYDLLENKFKDWHNKQYNNYNQNPYLFLYEVAK